jgi:hypothetical protein
MTEVASIVAPEDGSFNTSEWDVECRRGLKGSYYMLCCVKWELWGVESQIIIIDVYLNLIVFSFCPYLYEVLSLSGVLESVFKWNSLCNNLIYLRYCRQCEFYFMRLLVNVNCALWDCCPFPA